MHKSETASSEIDAPISGRTELGPTAKMESAHEGEAEFDRTAREYETLFKPWLKIAGASREYFARSRLHWLSHLLREQGFAAKRVMDFGCGTGMSLELLADILQADEVIGLDTSEESLAVARETINNPSIHFATPANYLPRQDLDLVFCNGVFHHIPLSEQPKAMNYVYRCLRPGGLIAMWENNPWNLIHAVAMKYSEIDRNAVPLSPPQSRQLVSSGPFRILRTDYLFFFPGYFTWLHPLEKRLNRVPLGAQYQVLGCKA